MDQETTALYHRIRETESLTRIYLAMEGKPGQQRKIRWRPIEANEDYMKLSVNALEQGSEEWIESCGNKTLHPSIEEVEDEDE